MDFVELILDPESESRLIEQKRVPGENNVGMIAWRLTLYTPEYPDGRDIIVIANDITFQIGSFGPGEDKIFGLASEMARKLKIPRVYISANSGARIGLAEEVKSLFKIAWEDNSEPDKGFRYVRFMNRCKNYSYFCSCPNAQILKKNHMCRFFDPLGACPQFYVKILIAFY